MKNLSNISLTFTKISYNKSEELHQHFFQALHRSTITLPLEILIKISPGVSPKEFNNKKCLWDTLTITPDLIFKNCLQRIHQKLMYEYRFFKIFSTRSSFTQGWKMSQHFMTFFQFPPLPM